MGGSVWRIVKDAEEIVYAVSFNHRRERHLNSTVLETACPRPSVLITDCRDALVTLPKRSTRDKEFLSKFLGNLCVFRVLISSV